MALGLFDMLENAGDDMWVRDFANHAKFPAAFRIRTAAARNSKWVTDITSPMSAQLSTGCIYASSSTCISGWQSVGR